MLKTMKTRYRNSVIEPLEAIDVEEGAKIVITVSKSIISAAEGMKKEP